MQIIRRQLETSQGRTRVVIALTSLGALAIALKFWLDKKMRVVSLSTSASNDPFLDDWLDRNAKSVATRNFPGYTFWRFVRVFRRAGQSVTMELQVDPKRRYAFYAVGDEGVKEIRLDTPMGAISAGKFPMIKLGNEGVSYLEPKEGWKLITDSRLEGGTSFSVTAMVTEGSGDVRLVVLENG